MNRKSIPVNTARQLWAQCGGYCQRPTCNKSLFASVGDDTVSLANVAHIIGHGANGPRSEPELAEHIEKDGLGNLIMLCLECHKIVDELERSFSADQMRGWKADHSKKIRALFDLPRITDECELLIQVNDLLEENAAIFKEYGPYSDRAINGDSGDTLTIWRRRCLDTLLPNNQRILDLIEKNKRNFPYPWDVYREMLGYKLHADAFKDNCLLGQRVNDYKLFPLEFDHFVKTKLQINVPPLETRRDEELEYRANQIRTFIERFLANHEFIEQMEELNIATFLIDLKDGRTLRAFVTNTYFFTEYTFDKVMAIDPEVDVIICSCPAGTYANSAKELCIENDIGLFMLGEFMGAIRKNGDEFLNYLLRAERDDRIRTLSKPLQSAKLPRGLTIYVFGSYIRRKLYRDIDVMLVYADTTSRQAVEEAEKVLTSTRSHSSSAFDFTVCSSSEFEKLRFAHDNLTKIFPSP